VAWGRGLVAGPVDGGVVCRGAVEGPEGGAPGAFGTPGPVAAPGVRRAIVGAGAGVFGAAGALFKGMVGAGVGGRGAPALGDGGGVGAPEALSSAFRVTRTVSFFKGTADVFFIGAGGLGGGGVS